MEVDFIVALVMGWIERQVNGKSQITPGSLAFFYLFILGFTPIYKFKVGHMVGQYINRATVFKNDQYNLLILLVGVRGFEPPTSCSQSTTLPTENINNHLNS